ncbi:hypothetical protein F4561_002321 [Lipingzhangella halophila]|uniref:Uncharacterized protein n=1 Tax=Lipingzhangella halophila TaxID=1783352 RepID=A0A7W7W288_9ACTN|nr:hypothetical protein [Lipingzhangella halophila]
MTEFRRDHGTESGIENYVLPKERIRVRGHWVGSAHTTNHFPNLLFKEAILPAAPNPIGETNHNRNHFTPSPNAFDIATHRRVEKQPNPF